VEEAPGIGDEEHDRPEQFFGVAESPQRRVRNDRVAAGSERLVVLLEEQPMVLRRVQESRRDLVDANVSLRVVDLDLYGQPLREVGHGSLGVGVARHIRERRKRTHRGGVDDDALALLREVLAEDLCRQERALVVEGEDLVHLFERQIGEDTVARHTRPRPIATRAVDENIDAAEGLDDRVERGGYAIGV
jgi:hypothetical protein